VLRVSNAYADHLSMRTDLAPLGPAHEMSFDAKGNLASIDGLA